MPADKTFEKQMQQQLDALRIQPPANDWQQIYAALHQTKRRRIIWWWWLPLAAVLISGSIYLSKEPSGAAREGNGNVGKTIEQKITGKDGKAITETVADDEKAVNDESKKGKDNTVNNEKSKNTKAQRKETQHLVAQHLHKEQTQERTTAQKQPSSINAKPNTDISTPKKWKASTKVVTIEKQDTVQHNSVSAATMALPQSSVAILSDTTEVVLPSLERFYADSCNSLPNLTAPWPWTNEEIYTPLPHTNIPRKWQTGWWAALGSTRLSQTTSLFGAQKAAADFNSNNPGNVRYVSSRTEKNGQYFSAGWLLRKPMGKRWAFSTGLGAGLQSWQVSTSFFADSILPNGSLYNRALTATSNQQYLMLALQVPMLLEWKLLGQQEGIWLQGGLNHQWLLQLREKQSTATLSQNFASNSNTINANSKAYSWQPQLRLGLVYQWQSKSFIHQMVPALQIPLRSALKTDNRGLLNIQLQYNILWLREKRGS